MKGFYCNGFFVLCDIRQADLNFALNLHLTGQSAARINKIGRNMILFGFGQG